MGADLHVGVVLFSETTHILFTLDVYTKMEPMLNTIASATFLGGSFTNTTAGIIRASDDVFTQSGDRPQVANVAVLLVNGIPTGNSYEMKYVAQSLQEKDIELISVGMQHERDMAFIYEITPNPDNVFLINNFTTLEVTPNMTNQICLASKEMEKTESTIGVHGMHYNYFIFW